HRRLDAERWEKRRDLREVADLAWPANVRHRGENRALHHRPEEDVRAVPPRLAAQLVADLLRRQYRAVSRRPEAAIDRVEPLATRRPLPENVGSGLEHGDLRVISRRLYRLGPLAQHLLVRP